MTLSDLGVNYLIPKRTTSTEQKAINKMEDDRKTQSILRNCDEGLSNTTSEDRE